MPRAPLSRADLPTELTPESLRGVPVHVLRAFQRHDNGVLSAEDQQAFDGALQAMMGQIAGRLHQQLDRTRWDALAQPGRAPHRDRDVQRIARRVEAQLRSVEGLAPGLDWSTMLSPAMEEPSEASIVSTTLEDTVNAPPADRQEPAPTSSAADHQTVSDVEATITDQVELLAAMNDIADVSRRTYALEQEREAQSTRSLFFGFLVSVAVIMAGWAPLVTASWPQRLWILGLTAVTCLVAAGVYALVRRRQQSIADEAD